MRQVVNPEYIDDNGTVTMDPAMAAEFAYLTEDGEIIHVSNNLAIPRPRDSDLLPFVATIPPGSSDASRFTIGKIFNGAVQIFFNNSGTSATFCRNSTNEIVMVGSSGQNPIGCRTVDLFVLRGMLYMKVWLKL